MGLFPDPTRYEVCRNCGGTEFNTFHGQTMGIISWIPIYAEVSCYECLNCGSSFKHDELPTADEVNEINAKLESGNSSGDSNCDDSNDEGYTVTLDDYIDDQSEFTDDETAQIEEFKNKLKDKRNKTG